SNRWTAAVEHRRVTAVSLSGSVPRTPKFSSKSSEYVASKEPIAAKVSGIDRRRRASSHGSAVTTQDLARFAERLHLDDLVHAQTDPVLALDLGDERHVPHAA